MPIPATTSTMTRGKKNIATLWFAFLLPPLKTCLCIIPLSVKIALYHALCFMKIMIAYVKSAALIGPRLRLRLADETRMPSTKWGSRFKSTPPIIHGMMGGLGPLICKDKATSVIMGLCDESEIDAILHHRQISMQIDDERMVVNSPLSA